MLYFGCWREAGHDLHQPGGHRIYGHSHQSPPLASNQLDAIFAPRGVNENEEATALTHVHGWTVLAMWDRSVDKRPGSNAAFLTQGTHDEAIMWDAARLHFPEIVARLKAAPKPAGET